jgi:transposase
MIFRHFGSKEALFDAAVLTPFTEFVSRHVADWGHRGPGSAPALEEAERLFDHLVGLFLEERSIVMALLAVYHFDDATTAVNRRLETAMRDVVTLVEARSVSEATARGNIGFDIPAMARIMVGMCFSLVTFPRLFATDGFSRERLVREMAQMTMYSVEFRNQQLKDDRDPAARATPEEAAAGPTPTAGTGAPRRIDDDTWARLAPALRASRRTASRGRPPLDDRAVIEGVIDVLSTGIAWRSLPTTRHGVSGTTCWRRLNTWRRQGRWDAAQSVLRSAGIDVPTTGPGSG